MFYIKQQNKLVETHSEIRDSFKNTISLPSIITTEILNDLEVYTAVDVYPTITSSQEYVLSTTPILVGTVWTLTHTLRDLTADEILANFKATVPQRITMRQARLSLLNNGLLSTVDNAIASGSDEEMKIEWEYTTEVKRDWPSLIIMATTLGITEAQLDGLFIQGATL